jgi:hypothetical protein
VQLSLQESRVRMLPPGYTHRRNALEQIPYCYAQREYPGRLFLPEKHTTLGYSGLYL